MAEYLLKAKDRENFEAKSAGLAAFPGQEAHEHVKQLLADRGIEVNHQAQPISDELMEWADLVLTMTQSHALALKERFPDHSEQIFPLKAYVDPDEKEVDIADPFGGDKTIYEQTLLEIEKWLERLLEKEKSGA
jgi:protein-tyrosine phosphatase